MNLGANKFISIHIWSGLIMEGNLSKIIVLKYAANIE